MRIDEIVQAIEANRINVTLHARREARNDSLSLGEIFFSTCEGEIIEDYPDDTPYPSCLIFGITAKGTPVHTVWAYDSGSRIAVLVTVYRPDPDRWSNWRERRDR